VTLVDGSPAGSIPATDRGLAFGDGIFRTIAVRAGRPLNWNWHWRRFAADAACLDLPLPVEAVVRQEIARVAPGDAIAKVTLTRGSGGRGYAPPKALPATRIVASFPWPDAPRAQGREGVAVRRCALVLAEQPRVAGAKTLNRLESVLARAEWDDAAFAEGLLADAAGRVVEGTMSNLFIVSGGRVATPRLDRCGVIGAQRERVREQLAAERIACDVRDLTWDEVLCADEAFLTNSVIGAWPIRAFESRRWEPGALTRRVQALIEADDALA
jgi:4-amino-4-deoxychorismate lyase